MVQEFTEKLQAFPMELAPGLRVLGNTYFNLYLIRGNTASALVEAGISAVVDTVIDQLAFLKTEPDYLIVTHPHADHVTGLPGLRQRFPQARVIAGDGTEGFLNHPKAQTAALFEDRFMHNAVRTRGILPGRPPLDRPPDLGDYRLVSDGARIDLGGVTLELLALEGHAPGNLGVWVPEIGALVVSDSLGFHYIQGGFLPLFFTGLGKWTTTLERLAAFPARILCPAHQGPLAGSRAVQAFQTARRATRDLFQRIVADPADPKALAGELFREYYRDEFTLYSDRNIRNCCDLLVRRGLE